MGKSKVTGPDGVATVVEHPDGATQSDIIGLAKQQRARPAAVPPTPSPERDVVGRAKEWLTREPPLGSKTMFGETDMPGRIVRAAGDLFLPGTIPEAARFAATLPIGGGMVTGPAMRTVAGGLAGGLANVAQGGSFLPEAASQGLSQFAGELLPGALRFGLTQRAARQELGGRAAVIGNREIAKGAETKIREDKIAHDTAMEQAVSDLEKQGYTRDVARRRAAESAQVREARAQHQEQAGTTRRTFAEQEKVKQEQHKSAVEAATTKHAADVRAYESEGAKTIAEGFKQQVPAFRDFPSNESGLLNMVYGEGQKRLSARFDEALRDVVTLGKGQTVNIPKADAEALGIKLPKIMKGPDGQPVAVVDAGMLAERVTGFWQKDHGVYRRSVNALDRANIGDPASRAEYRAGQALIQFADKSKMLQGEKFNPEAARAAFTSLKKIDELRRRGQGDIFQGPIAEAARRPAPQLSLPAEPAPGTPPVIPPFRRPAPLPDVPEPPRRTIMAPPEVQPSPPLSATPEGVRTRTLPKMGFWQGAAIAEIPAIIGGLATGHHSYSGYGLPVAVGGLLSSGLSGRTFATQAPLTPAAELALQLLPGMGAQEARRLTGQ